MYHSSSFVRKIGSSTTDRTDATSAASSASQKESTVSALGAMRAANSNMSASSTSTSSRPVIRVNGSRIAASTGGSTAFSTPMITATSSAPFHPSIDTPGTSAAAKHT